MVEVWNHCQERLTQAARHFPQLSHAETSVHIWVAAVLLFLCVLIFWHESWHLVAHMLALLSEHHPNRACAAHSWKAYCLQPSFRGHSTAKTWSVSVCSGVYMPQNVHTSVKLIFYEFVKSLKRLISSSRCNWLSVLVNAMGGQWLTTTVHIVIYWLLFVFYTVRQFEKRHKVQNVDIGIDIYLYLYLVFIDSKIHTINCSFHFIYLYKAIYKAHIIGTPLLALTFKIP